MSEAEPTPREGDHERKKGEPLPQTKITEAARDTLLSWGIRQEQIDDIRRFTSQFRYDLCPEKVERLTKREAELFEKEGREYVNIPSFFDVTGRLVGECGGIGNQWVIKMDESGLFDKLKLNNPNLVTAMYSGRSETHFHTEGTTHVWNGIVLQDHDGAILDEIYCDAAFQIIKTKAESS